MMLSTHIPVYHGKEKVTGKLYAWVINGKLRCATLSTYIGLMSRFLFLNVVWFTLHDVKLFTGTLSYTFRTGIWQAYFPYNETPVQNMNSCRLFEVLCSRYCIFNIWYPELTSRIYLGLNSNSSQNVKLLYPNPENKKPCINVYAYFSKYKTDNVRVT